MKHYVKVEMPYEPVLSVNRCYYRGSARLKKKPVVEAWLYEFKSKLLRESPPDVKGRNIKMDLTIIAKMHGFSITQI